MTTLKEILAFNEQVVGLRRSGSSVNLGLPRSPNALESALNQITSELSGRSAADQGQGSAAFEDRLLNSKSLPLPYQQTVEAGIREGRLPAAFEGIIESSRISERLRKQTRVSMVYPLFVFALACCLMAILAVRTLWQYEATHDVLRLPHTGWTDWATALSAFGLGWLLVPIAVLMGLGILTWLLRRSSRNKNYASFPRWLPGYGGFERDLRLASFTDTLLQLRRKGIDKTQAMSLAAAVSGHPLRVEKATDLLALDSLPPLLRWAMFEADSQPTSVEFDGLELAADVYRERATRRAHFISQTLPVILCVAVGFVIVLAYALTVWGPFCQMIIELSNVQGGVL